MRPSIADDLREIRRATKAVKKIARDMAEIFGPPAPVPVPNFAPSPKDTVKYLPAKPPRELPVELPANYSFVQCDSCGSLGLLVHDLSNGGFAAACPQCRTITHLEAIIEECDEQKKHPQRQR